MGWTNFSFLAEWYFYSALCFDELVQYFYEFFKGNQDEALRREGGGEAPVKILATE